MQSERSPAPLGRPRQPGPASHLDLLAIAGGIRRATVSEDTDRLHGELTRLRTALIDHVHAERERLDVLPGMTSDVVRDGQRRLLRLLDDVLFSAAGDAADDCNCLVRAAEIEVALHRQAVLEANLLRRHPRSSTTT